MKLMYGFAMLVQRGIQTIHGPARRRKGEAAYGHARTKLRRTPKARTKRKARLHLFPVLVLFRPVIGGPRGRPDGSRVRPFPVFLPWLTGKSPAPGCVRCPVFLLLFTGIYRQAGVDRTLPLRPETRKCFRDLARGHCASAASAAHPIPTRAGTGRPRRRSRRVRSRRSPPPCGRRGRARGRQAPPGDCWALPSPRRGEAHARSPIRRAAG